MNPVRGRVLADGLIAGSLAYVVVVLFISAVDVMSGRSPLYTASLLGEVLLGGARTTGGGIDPAAVISYNGVHLVAFLIVGFVAAWLEHETELHPALWYFAVFLLMAAALYAFLALLLVSQPASGALSAWVLAVGTALGWATVIGWLAGARRRRAAT